MGFRGRVLIAFIRLGRPQFLVGGFLLYGIGAALAVYRGAGFDVTMYALGQATVTSIQLMTHYANDYFDLAADQANVTPTRWSGGSRILPSGILAPRVALIAARVLGAMGLLGAGVIAGRGIAGGAEAGVGALVAAGVLVLAQALAWFYSAPPVALHSRGLGELTTALVVTGLTPLAGFLLQFPHVAGMSGTTVVRSLAALGAVLWPLIGLQFTMLLAIEFPDAAGDAAVGKRTLVVRRGGPAAAALGRAVLVAVYGALPLFAVAGFVPAPVLWGAAWTLPVAVWQFLSLGQGGPRGQRGPDSQDDQNGKQSMDTRNNPEQWASLAFRGVALLVATAAGELAGLVWLITARAA
jgi:1,4-dihydroxy-2-naphthoate octaprenyltransferase